MATLQATQAQTGSTKHQSGAVHVSSQPALARVTSAADPPFSSAAPDPPSVTRRPVVAVVLGGGGARGEAHAMRRIEEIAALARDDVLRAKLGDLLDRPLDLDRLKLGLDRIDATEAFESVRYRLDEDGERTGLAVSVTPHSWGRDALNFGLRVAAERRRGAEFDFGVAYEAQAMHELNDKWRTEFQLGQGTLPATEIYQPLDPAEYWFVNARLGASDTLRKRYVINQAVSEYGSARTGVLAALGANVDRYGDVRTGFRRYVSRTRSGTGLHAHARSDR